MLIPKLIAVYAFIWLGHACIWTYFLNNLYARRLPKRFLKLWRLMTGFVIVSAIPISYGLCQLHDPFISRFLSYYRSLSLFIGGVVFPVITLLRIVRTNPACVASETSRVLDLRAELGSALYGDGKWHRLAALPFNDIFRVEFTEYTLKLPQLPAVWDGLTILHLSDFHFHGTPSKLYFERILQEIHAGPVPNIVALTGDYVDSDAHVPWIRELLGTLKWNEVGLAVLGNHDVPHHPDLIADELRTAGFNVISNRWQELTIRGERCVVVGNEMPWLRPLPDLTAAPQDCFRLCLSHSPDQFEQWAVDNHVDLMLCGHVHGGQIRLPVIGSIFVPSVHSRKYDQGVFQRAETTMVVTRGLSGKEPLRFRCPAQVIRITLRNSVGSTWK
ncbi:hypothetical protein BH11PLA2_BH11PLA2_32300 [soil metagenome]